MSAPQPGPARAEDVTARAATADDGTRRRVGLRRFVVLGLLVALLLAGVVSAFASANPDGLDAVTRAGCTFNSQDEVVSGHCVAQQARAHGLEGSPFAGYETQGVSGVASTGLSGVAGVLVTLVLALGGALLLRRRGVPHRGR